MSNTYTSEQRLAVVILNWNGAEFLRRFLPGVIEHSVDISQGETLCRVEVIVADNASTDDSLELLKRDFHDTVRVVPLEENYGFAEGYNRAFAALEGYDYFVLLNSDVQVTPGWLMPLWKLLLEKDHAAAVMPKIRSFTDPEKFEYAGACGGFIDRYGYPFCRGRIFDTVEIDNGQYDKGPSGGTSREIFWATGAAMLIRAELFHKCGGFDNWFFAHMEEIDLCWRLKRMGYGIWVESASVVYHVGGGTLPADSDRKVYLNFRNNLAMLYKNLSPSAFRRVALVRGCLDNLASAGWLFTGKGKRARAVWKARRDFRKEKERWKAQRPGQVVHFPGMYPGSILWRYWTGTRIFDQLKF